MSIINETRTSQATTAYRRWTPYQSPLSKLKWLLMASVASSHFVYGAESLLDMRGGGRDDGGSSVMTAPYASSAARFTANEWGGDRRQGSQTSQTLEHFLTAFERTAFTPTPDPMYMDKLTFSATRGHLVARALLGHVLLRRDKSSAEGERYLEEAQVDLLNMAGNPGEEGKDEGAQLCVGLMYWWGHTLDKEEREALKWLEPLARSRNRIAQMVLERGAETPDGSDGNASPRPQTKEAPLRTGGERKRRRVLAEEQRVEKEAVAPYLKAGQDVNEPDAEDWTPLHRAAGIGDVRGCLGLMQRGAEVDKAVEVFRNDGDGGWGWLFPVVEKRTPLFIAAEKGHREVCELLLAKGATVDQANKNGWTPLYVAAQKGHRDVCELLLAKGAALDQAPDKGLWNGATPLYVAARGGHREVCELLLAKGAAVDKANKNGITPFYVAARYGHLEVCELLLAKGATVDQAEEEGRTPLFAAAREGHREVCELLLARGATVDKANYLGETPLWMAAQKGRREVCELLLAKGANPLQKRNNGQAPIDVASKEEIRRLLWQTRVRVPDSVVTRYLKVGQDINKPDAADWTPLQRAAKKEDVEGCLGLMQRGAAVDQASDDGWTPLYVAAQGGHREVCELLLAKGAAVDKANKNGITPFYVAARGGHREVCELLLAKGAAVDKANKNGITPFYVAARYGHLEVCELLLAKGATVDQAEEEGRTPLFAAAREGHWEVCALLLAKGAAVDKANKDGCTPLYIAAAEGHWKVCVILLSHRADVNKAKNDGSTPLDVAKKKKIKELLRRAGGRGRSSCCVQ